MAGSLAEVLRELSPEDRDEVERGARRLLIESRTLRTICREFSVTQDQLTDAPASGSIPFKTADQDNHEH
jgi:hypothetical protein